jgi:DNA-binding PadR family transcriptional regulator
MPPSSRQPFPDPDAVLPLKPVEFHVLLTLAGRECHGYGIVQAIAERTGGRLRIEPGNLYRSLRAMLADGVIEESARRPAPDLDDERRRYYRITAFGRRVAAAEASRLEALVASARACKLVKGRA